MTKSVSISDDLAALLDDARRRAGLPSLDAAAEAAIARGLSGDGKADHSAGRTDDQLRELLDEAESSGPAEAWDAAEVRRRLSRPKSRS